MVLVDFAVNGSGSLFVSGWLDRLMGDGRGHFFVDRGVVVTRFVPIERISMRIRRGVGQIGRQ